MNPRPTVLVTGGAGYIGSHLLLELMERCDLVVLDDLSRGHADAVPAGMPLHVVSLGDAQAVRNLLRSRPIDAVIHCAAFAYVAESMRDPALYFRNNCTGLLNLLEGMREAGIGRIVFSSSCAIYGIPRQLPIGEDHPLAPINPYGESKAMCERMLHWHQAAHGLQWISLRYFNAAGADAQCRAGERHDPEPHVLPLLLQTALGRREHFTILGDDYPTADGTCVRDYIHVTDLAEAHGRALDRLLDGGASQAINLGTGQGLSVRQLIAAAERITGRPVPVKIVPRRPGDPAVLVADASRAAERLGWQPRHSSMDEILGSALAWMQRGAALRRAGNGPVESGGRRIRVPSPWDRAPPARPGARRRRAVPGAGDGRKAGGLPLASCFPARLALVDAHVVHLHGLRIRRGGVGHARPVPAHRQVQQDEFGLVEDPARRALVGGVVGVPVNEEGYLARRPVHREDVVMVGELLVARQRVGNAGIEPVRAVQAAVYRGGLLADVLHNVDLAAAGPSPFSDVGAERPEGGPHALAVGNLDAGFDAAVAHRELAQRLQARRGNLPIRCAQRLNDQVTLAILKGVLEVVGVVLEFLVSPTVGAEFVHPLRRVGRGLRGAVELIVPDELPARAGLGAQRQRKRGQQQQQKRQNGASGGTGTRRFLGHGAKVQLQDLRLYCTVPVESASNKSVPARAGRITPAAGPAPPAGRRAV